MSIGEILTIVSIKTGAFSKTHIRDGRQYYQISWWHPFMWFVVVVSLIRYIVIALRAFFVDTIDAFQDTEIVHKKLKNKNE